MREKIYLLLIVLFLLGCAATPNKPEWLSKLKNVPELLEGKGFAPVGKDIKQARDEAYGDAIQKLVMAGEIQVKGLLETKVFSHREIMDDKNKPKIKGEDILNNINKVIYDTVLERKYFEEYFDSKNKEYWVYVYIPVSGLNRIATEATIKSLQKAEVASEKTNSIISDLEKDLQNYKEKENKELQSIK